MKLLLLATFSVLLLAQITEVRDAIIIGAGTAGIAASKLLNQKKINHIIIQSRDRIGGRIVDGEIDGLRVDLGASFVHSPTYDNPLHQLIQSMNWPTIPGSAKKTQEFSLNKYTLTDQESTQYYSAVKQMQAFIGQFANTQDTDLETAYQAFYNLKKGSYSEQIFTRLYFQLQMEGAVNGADLNLVSAKYYNANSEVGTNDYLPSGGYFSLLKAIFQKCCSSTKVHFNETVTSIDYQGAIIKITTKKGTVFYCKKVIVSVPLGVLKRNKITFTPALPATHAAAIKQIGFGVFNKVFVSLQQQFWKSESKVLNFVASKSFYNKYEESYVVSQSPSSKILMFFMAGNKSIDANKFSNEMLVKDLEVTLKNFVPSPTVKNYTITRWEQDEHTLGSYSFVSVGTTKQHFRDLRTAISEKLWFVGEHTHPRFGSNVHGAYDSGRLAGEEVAESLSGAYLWLGIMLLASLLLI